MDIDEIKVDIDEAKVDIISKFPTNISEKTINHAVSLYLNYGKYEHFGRWSYVKI